MSRPPAELADKVGPPQHDPPAHHHASSTRHAEIRNWLIVVGLLITSGSGAAAYFDLFRGKTPEQTHSASIAA